MSRIPRPSASMIVALIALAIALAGTAVALPGKGSVTSNDLKKGAVTKKALKKGAVTAKALKKGAVGGKALAAGGVGAAALAPGSVGTAAIADGSVTEPKVAAAEALHVLGTPGQPNLETGGDGDCLYTDVGPMVGDVEPAGFYKDPYDRVYLSGLIQQAEAAGGDGDCGDTSVNDNSRDQVFFILPPAYRPAHAVVRPTSTGDVIINGPTPLTVAPPEIALPPGSVALSAAPGDVVAISGIDFRAAGAAGRAAARAGAGAAPTQLPPAIAKQLGL